ncbi:rho GTPase-activating protein REN1 [Salvia miltiorrhiza]|uniref:rho GTPase-activating protein REN1 n=1 Tax=Salvia miltiorrhiza TaxID=226208 RepID=UPI0025AC948A|nr:rho GTPase-activating protein REN1 [Salvia miltiorrhiza]
MTNVNNNAAAAAAESSQAEAGGGKNEPPPPPAPPSPALHAGSKVYKSGPLFLSSKGIGWTSWKKRWFILTQTSLVFYRSDPNAVPQKSSEVNLTLGGIDLNSSGSVVVKEDKKLLTVLFPDGRDGRAFTLKAETLEDLHEWKAALEEALSNAPNAALVTGQNGMFKNDQSNAADTSSDQAKDRQAAKSLVLGRPILLALEDIDGTPSFLEKALRFIEEHGVKTEGILRQAADVEDVERRIQEYEKGKNEFSLDEDAHVIADCVKYVIRELPSSPVPASCCKALLESCRTDRSVRVAAMRSAICETFPEPNRRLLQRILMMMQTIASHKTVNRMSISAVAACMAPLLLRPLLAGECELDHNMDLGADGSFQLLQAAAAANHAQAIVITLLEEYENIFGDVAVSHEPYTDSEESGTESEEITDDDDESFEEDDMTEGTESEMDEDFEHESGASSENGEHKYSEKVSRNDSSGSKSPHIDDVLEANQRPPQTSLPRHDSTEGTDDVHDVDDANMHSGYSELVGADHMRKPNWGRAAGKKNLSMESIDLPLEDEAAIQKLEFLQTDLQSKILNEAATNSLLQDGLDARKYELHERRLSLEKEVAGLLQQLQKEIELKKALEAALRISQLPLSVSSLIDDQVKAELEVVTQAEANVTNLKEKADDLEFQLRQQREQNYRLGQDISNQLHQNANQLKSFKKEKQMDGGHSSSTSDNLSRSKQSDKQGNDRNKKRESSSSLNIPLPQNQQADTVQNPKSNSETGTTRSSSRKSSKGEGSNSTNALSKLSNRLNFLKERRSQIATELQNLDKGRNAAQHLEQGGESEQRRHSHQESRGKSSDRSQHGDKARKREKGLPIWNEGNLKASLPERKFLLNFLRGHFLGDSFKIISLDFHCIMQTSLNGRRTKSIHSN